MLMLMMIVVAACLLELRTHRAADRRGLGGEEPRAAGAAAERGCQCAVDIAGSAAQIVPRAWPAAALRGADATSGAAAGARRPRRALRSAAWRDVLCFALLRCSARPSGTGRPEAAAVAENGTRFAAGAMPSRWPRPAPARPRHRRLAAPGSGCRSQSIQNSSNFYYYFYYF